MIYLYITTGVALLVSLIASREKTGMAFKIAFKQFAHIFPAFLAMLILVSLALFMTPEKTITHYLVNNNKFIGLFLAAALGSLTLMPGFIVFPLAGILLKSGVPYMVLSAFTTTLMMVGVMTYPIEKKYFGFKAFLLRNTISFFIALIVALVTGIVFGEVF